MLKMLPIVAIFFGCYSSVFAEEQYGHALITNVQRFGIADDRVPFVRVCLAVREYIVVHDDLTTERRMLSPAFVGAHDAFIHLEGRRCPLHRSDALYYVYLNIPDDGHVAMRLGQRFYLNIDFVTREFHLPPMPENRIPRQVDGGMDPRQMRLVDHDREQYQQPNLLRPRAVHLPPLDLLDGSM